MVALDGRGTEKFKVNARTLRKNREACGTPSSLMALGGFQGPFRNSRLCHPPATSSLVLRESDTGEQTVPAMRLRCR